MFGHRQQQFFGRVLGRGIACLALSLHAATVSAQTADYDDIRAELFRELNRWRSENGASAAQRLPLIRDRFLDESIQTHVQDKARCGYSAGGGAHFSCDRRTLNDRAADYVEGLTGRIGVAENMAFGNLRARDREFTERQVRAIILDDVIRFNLNSGNLTEAQLENPAVRTALDAQVDTLFAALQARPATEQCGSSSSYIDRAGNSFRICKLQAGDTVKYIEAGFIDTWARSTAGHRANMLGAFAAVGVGYAEGIGPGGERGPISGQMFGTQAKMAGVFEATGISSLFVLAEQSPSVPTLEPPTGMPGTPAPSIDPPDEDMIDMPLPEDPPPTTLQPRQPLPPLSADAREVFDAWLMLTLRETERGMLDEVTQELINAILEGEGEVMDETARLLERISPGQYDAQATNGLFLDLALYGVLRQRLAKLRASERVKAGGVTSSASIVPRTLTMPRQGAAMPDPDAKRHGSAAQLADPEIGGSAVWAHVFGGTGELDAEGIYSGYDRDHYSAMLGIDVPIGSTYLGLAAAAGQVYTRFDSNIGDADSTHHSLGVYASLMNRARSAYAEMILGGSYLENIHERALRVGTSAADMRASYDAWTAGAVVGVGLLLGIGEILLEPSAHMYFHYQSADTFTESETGGDDALALRLDEREYRTLGAQVGLSANRELAFGYQIRLKPKVGLYFALEEPLDERELNAAFVGASSPMAGGNAMPATPIVLAGRDEVRAYFWQEVGFEALFGPYTQVTGDFVSVIGSGLEDYQLSLGLSHAF